LQVDGEPAATAGVVSVVEGSVYLGNGATAVIIGSVDPDFDGRNGRKLRINFTSPFVNPSFEDGELGWTLMEQWINLGETVIAGHR
ncbi:hypothetical protein HER39_15785, partial [Arthrobacter deserti]|nr:hypothetical protein [Arthrobacter deserti]